jgi:hypothetical protein
MRMTHLIEELVLELSCNHTLNQQMLNVFLHLVTQRAIIWMRETTSFQPISCPTPIMRDYHIKKQHLGGAQDFKILSKGLK